MDFFQFKVVFYLEIYYISFKIIDMLLDSKKIADYKLLIGAKPENFQGSSYYLSIGEITSLDGRDKKLTEFEIPPQGMVLVYSDESFDMNKPNILGYTTVRNTLSIKGILAINVGIVDPGYQGKISSVLINFGKRNVRIAEGEKFLRMTFHSSDSKDYGASSEVIEDKVLKVINKKYKKETDTTAYAFLSEKFLSLDKVKDEILVKLFKRTGIAVAAVITGIALISGVVAIMNYASFWKSENIFKKSEKGKLELLQSQVDSLTNVVERQSMMIEVLKDFKTNQSNGVSKPNQK